MEILEKQKIIKILACTLILSFVGCGGGGGGGGGSSAPSVNPIPNSPNIEIPNINDGSYNIGHNINTNNTISGKINLSGDKTVGITGKNINSSSEIYIEDIRNENINNLKNHSFGIFSENGKVNFTGKINLSGDKTVGIFGNNSDITNNGEIKSINSSESIGIFSKGTNGIARNNGFINLFSNKAVGMFLDNSLGVNNRIISSNSNNKAIGIFAIGKNSNAINNKEIFIDSNNEGYGMIAGYGARATNNGTITILNKGYGMVAYKGGYALNDINGVINLSSKASGGMLAYGEGAVVENRGTIIIDRNNSIIKDGDELKAIDGGKIINKGIIKKDGYIDLISKNGIYSIGTERNGNYGKIQSNSLNINGNLEIDTEIVKENYRNEYVLEDIFVADTININENVSIKSDSLLYDAKLKNNNNGNLDGILTRNDKELGDFVGNKLEKTAKVFSEYYDEENYKNLDEVSKNIINKIDVSNENSLNENLAQLTPSIYGNRKNQVLELNNLFEEGRRNAIHGMNGKENNFVLLEDFYKINSKDEIDGYKNLVSGFLRTKKVGENDYLSFGYSHSEIDYENDMIGKIESIHFGADKIIKADENILKFGGGFEYNFHKNEREVFNENISSKFNSYGLNSYGEVGRKYENNIIFEPFMRYNIVYYKLSSFDENIDNFILDIKDEDFLIVKPEIGMRVNKKFGKLNLYSNIKYSYEINREKDKVRYEYKNLGKTITLENNKSNEGNLDIKLGTSYIDENFEINFHLGKEFSNRNKEYIELSIGYKF